MTPRKTDAKAGKDGALDKYGIYCIPSLDHVNDCPQSILQVLGLVRNTNDLRIKYFLERPDWNASNYQSKFDTLAAHDYDMRLAQRAEDLAIRCTDDGMKDALEAEWVKVLSPQVFLRFSPKDEEALEERRAFYHCLACRRNFQLGSRLILNGKRKQRAKAIPRPEDEIRHDFELCESTDRHFNLPNFAITSQVPYRDDDGHFEDASKRPSSQIPDATIGLGTYDLNKNLWDQEADLANNDRVGLFNKMPLKECLEHFNLEGPYCKLDTKHVTLAYPMFGFGLWEAKKTDGSHFAALHQTARKLASLLRWQRKIFNEADCQDSCPLTWFFSSVGPEWQVHACFQTRDQISKKCRYPMVKLWSGSAEESDGALQLLYIMDIIAFWGEHTYKPVIAACLSRLQAIKAGRDPPSFTDTLWPSQIALSQVNTPWFFKQRSEYEALLSPPVADKAFRNKNHRRSFDSSLRIPSPSLPSIGSRSSSQVPSSQERRPVTQTRGIYERDQFNWLLDKDPGGGDLLLVRLDSTGKLLPPIVFFDCPKWSLDLDDENMEDVLEDEERRHDAEVVVRYTPNTRGRNYLWQYLHSDIEVAQFCAIVPLDWKRYNTQGSKSAESQLFEPLESLLNIPMLLKTISRFNDKWCECQTLWNRYSTDMIQCSNARCELIWYHFGCAGLDTDEKPPTPWLCKHCKLLDEREREDIPYLDYDDSVEDSSFRVHHTKTLMRVWNAHPWPKQSAIVRLINMITLDVDILQGAQKTIRKKGIKTNLDVPRYWVFPKVTPIKLIRAAARKQQEIYYEDTTNDKSEIDSGYEEGEGHGSDEGTINDIEQSLGKMKISKGKEITAWPLARSWNDMINQSISKGKETSKGKGRLW